MKQFWPIYFAVLVYQYKRRAGDGITGSPTLGNALDQDDYLFELKMGGFRVSKYWEAALGRHTVFAA